MVRKLHLLCVVIFFCKILLGISVETHVLGGELHGVCLRSPKRPNPIRSQYNVLRLSGRIAVTNRPFSNYKTSHLAVTNQPFIIISDDRLMLLRKRIGGGGGGGLVLVAQGGRVRRAWTHGVQY